MGTIRIFLLTADSAEKLEALFGEPLEALENNAAAVEFKIDTDRQELARVSMAKEFAMLKYFKIE
jgi:hypothetical protein